MSVAIDLIAGTVGGAAAVLVEHPFDTVKVLMQAGRYDSYLSCARGVLATEGAKGFYRGMSARLVASGFEHAVVFASYKFAIRAVGGDVDRPTLWQVCVGGCGSGVAAMLCLTPFELVKCKLQADDVGSSQASSSAMKRCRGVPRVLPAPPQVLAKRGGRLCAAATHEGAVGLRATSRDVHKLAHSTAVPLTHFSSVAAAPVSRQYASSWDCVRHVYHDKGLRGLYKGGVATLYREVPGTAAWCGTYDYLKRTMTPAGESPRSLPLWKLTVAGGCAGVAFWAAMFPADVVKTRMQVDPSFDGLTFAQAVRRQYRQCGWKGLYRGFGLTALRSFPSNAVIFVGFAVCSRALSRLEEEEKAAAELQRA